MSLVKVPTVKIDESIRRLREYALTQINSDRRSFGLAPVTFSTIQSGQQHANSMFKMRYFSHWNNLGYKPYMRYTILGGLNLVDENIAYTKRYPPGIYRGHKEVQSYLHELEYLMMYRDEEWNNGHRSNILNEWHNRVSLGVSYGVTGDSFYVYLVEDFEDYYLDLSLNHSLNGNVTLSGKKLSRFSVDSINIFFDPYPRSVNREFMSRLRSYDPGILVGGVVSLNNPLYFKEGITEKATIWNDSSESIRIGFSMSPFIKYKGTGIYTLYLHENSTDRNFTSISLFLGKQGADSKT